MAPSYCCVKNCWSNSQKDKHLSFFRFPKDKRWETWVRNCNRLEFLKNVEKSRNFKVCALHFENEMFAGLARDRLKVFAVPTLFGESIVYVPTSKPSNLFTGLTAAESAKLKKFEEKHCAVLGCPYTSSDSQLSFFSFPMDPTRAKEWALICGRIDLLKDLSTLHNTYHLCWAHFDFSSFNTDKCTLRPNAIPTIFNKPSTFRITECDVPEYASVETVIDDEIKLDFDEYEWSLKCEESFQEKDSILLKALPNNLIQEPVSTDPLNINSSSVELVNDDDNDVKFVCSSVPAKINDINHDHPYRKTISIEDQIIVQKPEGMFLNINLGHLNSVNPRNICGIIVLVDNNQQVPLPGALISQNIVLRRINQNTNNIYAKSVEININKPKDIVPGITDIEVIDRPKRTYKKREKGPEKTYKCKICSKGKIYQTKKNYKRHIRNVHYYHCRNCKDSYKTAKEIKNHIKQAHPEVDYRTCKPYYCDICNEPLLDKPTTLRHLKTLHNFVICGVCSMSFLSKEELMKHREMHPDKFICELCNRGFKEKNSLTAHKETHNNPYTFVCPKCGKGCKSKSTYRVHLRTHDEIVRDRDVMCDICSKMYSTMGLLKVHQRRVHVKSRNMQCPACNKKFSRNGGLKAHYQVVHAREKLYQCEVCGKRFARSDYLHNHRRIHMGEPAKSIDGENKQIRKVGQKRKFNFSVKKYRNQPVECNICGKMLKSVDYLKVHVNTHSRIRKFKCSFCELLFLYQFSRDRHQRLHEQDPEHKYICPVCWKRVRTQDELDAHVGAHKRPKRHACRECGEFFSRKHQLENHIASKHTTEEELHKIEEHVIKEGFKNILNGN